MKNLKTFEKFSRSEKKNESYENVQQTLWNFQNKPLLGGYFCDVDCFLTFPSRAKEQVPGDKWNKS